MQLIPLMKTAPLESMNRLIINGKLHQNLSRERRALQRVAKVDDTLVNSIKRAKALRRLTRKARSRSRRQLLFQLLSSKRL